MIYDGSLKSRVFLVISRCREVLGDIFSFGMVSQAREVEADGWREAHRLHLALEQFADPTNWYDEPDEFGGNHTCWRGDGRPEDIAEAALKGGDA